jgi:hypothetical protein
MINPFKKSSIKETEAVINEYEMVNHVYPEETLASLLKATAERTNI